MQIQRLGLEGPAVIKTEMTKDDRGGFARAFCASTMDEAGFESHVNQANCSVTSRAGTVRGVHFQAPPHAEQKLVRCIRGSVLDVVIDLRPESPTFLQSEAVELSQTNCLAMLVPQRFGHLIQTLCDDCELLYLVSRPHTPGAEGGLRWDDPALGLQLPLDVGCISTKDASWPMFDEQADRLLAEMSVDNASVRRALR